jgi:hypothetical protein
MSGYPDNFNDLDNLPQGPADPPNAGITLGYKEEAI